MALTANKYIITNGAPSGNTQPVQSDNYGPDDINTIINNIGLTNLNIAINNGWTIFNMIDGTADEFADESGIDTATSTNEVYDDSANTYGNGGSFTGDIVVQSETTNGSTTFTDSSDNAFTCTAEGQAQHSTAEAKFGSSSMLFDGAGDGVSVPNNAAWQFGTGDFTIEFWFNAVNVSLNKGLAKFGANITSDYGWLIDHNGPQIRFIYSDDGTTGGTTACQTTSAGLTNNTWHHVAVVRNSGTLDIYVDGTSRYSATQSASFFAATGTMNFGRAFSTYHDGYMEEFRIVKGTAIYTTSFTPPTAPFAGAVTDITLVSNSTTAESTPTDARAVVLHEPVDSTTLNTDLTLEFSRDGGTTWTSATLTDEGSYNASVNILTTGDLDLTGQPSGTSMKYRFTTANSKQQLLHGIYMQWR